ncbi:twin-arginine translocase subunit TatC [Candidatus Poribacteria bacterium]|nr:twin-arginine translocase subunit TatC [Candidatus Poribacteria bacterium]
MKSRSGRDDVKEMTFLEHLEELRRRIIVCIIAVFVGMVISIWFKDQLLNFLELPLRFRAQRFIGDLLRRATGGRDNSIWNYISLFLRSRSSMRTNVDIIITGPLESFLALLRISLATGTVMAAPVLLYEIWAFVLPALKPHEKRYALPLFALLTFFFIIGAFFAFFVVAPIGLEVFANLWGGYHSGLRNLWTLNRYVTFITKLILGFGAAFELPIVMAFISYIGIIDSNGFRERRRYAIVLIMLLSAFLTPSDVLTMLLMAGPLMALYELGIWFSVLTERRREPLTDG